MYMQDLFEFIKQYPVRSYDKGQTVFSSTEICSTALVISTGYAKVTTTDGSYNEQTLWIAGRSDVVPSEQLFSKNTKLVFSYTALSPMTVFQIPKVDFLKFIDENRLAMKEVARGMSGHYDDLMYRLSSVTQASAREKLVYTLHNLAERFSASEEVDLIDLGLDITHQDIAGLMHASRETASIELNKLRDEGAIHYDRHSFIVYRSKLRQILDPLN